LYKRNIIEILALPAPESRVSAAGAGSVIACRFTGRGWGIRRDGVPRAKAVKNQKDSA
jgi:hypothetical protein